jgi:hypothetical protein
MRTPQKRAETNGLRAMRTEESADCAGGVALFADWIGAGVGARKIEPISIG